MVHPEAVGRSFQAANPPFYRLRRRDNSPGTASRRLHSFTRQRTGRFPMPAKSKAQQKAAGAALSAKRGDTPKSKLKGPSKSMAKSMSEKELKDMAKGSRKGKPARASKKK
jgi:hypothetical protein